MLQNLRNHYLHHKNKIGIITGLASGIANYSLSGSKFSLVEGIVKAAEMFCGIDLYNASKVFSKQNGYVPICNSFQMNGLLVTSLQELPHETLNFNYDSVSIVKSTAGEIVWIDSNYDGKSGKLLCEESKKEAILKLLIDIKFESLNSNFLLLSADNVNKEIKTPNLIGVKAKTGKSSIADALISEITAASALGISRSYLLNGLPGSGKSTIAETIIHHFGYRTLRFKPNGDLNDRLILELIKLLKIEAVILDDFDRVKTTDSILDLLETVGSQMKVTLAISNSLEDFDPAIKRPGRIDEIIQVNHLDKETVLSLLGNLSDSFYEKVKDFPIAYIQELVVQSKLNPDKLDDKFQNLEGRVQDLKNSYKRIKNDKNT